jgi:hypothetical protein
MSETPPIVEVRKIVLKENWVLEIEMTQPFIDRLRQHFGIFGEQPLLDEHVKNYVLGVATTAVEKAEREVTEDVVKSPIEVAVPVRRTRRRSKKGEGS